MAARLKAEDLTCARAGVPVVSGLNFELGLGDALILKGPNGSGKTTLLRTLAGLQPAFSGSVAVDPETLSYAAHADGIKGLLTVSENLAFWAGVYGTGPLEPALTAFDLMDLAHRPAQNLSAGQKRRLGLARLLVTGRDIWLLDEPTVSLDTGSTSLFRNVLEDHLRGGGAAIIATHIDLGLDADVLDLGAHQVEPASTSGAFDEAFL